MVEKAKKGNVQEKNLFDDPRTKSFNHDLNLPGVTSITSSPSTPLFAGAIAVKWLHAPSFRAIRSIRRYAKYGIEQKEEISN